MRWADIDLDEATVCITNTRTVMGNDIVVEKDAKSLAGERQLPLPTPVVAALSAFRAAQADEKTAAGQGYENSGYVLVDAGGRALNGRSCVSGPTKSWTAAGCAGFVCTTPVRAA